jgi:sulfotransferase
MKEIIYLSGLPRSGSTLLCNLLDRHSEISSTPSSPLCGLINNLRKTWSDDPFLLAQLDSNFDVVYKRLKRSIKAFMEEWSSDTNSPITIDKNRGWCNASPMLQHLYPNFKMIICLRDLRDIFSSIEKRHRETLLLDFPDHTDHHIVDNRASSLFNDNGVVGAPLKALYNLGDIPNIMRHIYFWKFEDFLKEPQKSMDELFAWIGVSSKKIDFNNIEQTTTQEADSYYRFKYMHKIKPNLEQPETLEDRKISPRILKSIVTKFPWYYENYYQELGNSKVVSNEIKNEIDEELANSIEESIEESTEESTESIAADVVTEDAVDKATIKKKTIKKTTKKAK